MKKIISLCITMALLFAMAPQMIIPVRAASGACGNNVYWSLDDSGTLYISGTGKMDDFNQGNNLPEYSLFRDSITSVVIELGVTRIGSNAFYSLSNLNQVSISESVIEIGKYAFLGCINLVNITLPDGVETIEKGAFWNCEKLENVFLSDSIVTIGDCAFYQCRSLASIEITENVAFIGASAFSYCDQLCGIYAVEENCSYNNDANGVLFSEDGAMLVAAPGSLSGSYTIPIGVTIIGDGAFAGCKKLNDISFPNSIVAISESAFGDCDSLSYVILPNGLEEIGSNAFWHCSELESITIPSSVSIIDKFAFRACEKLNEVIFLGNAPAFLKDANNEETCFNNVTATVFYPADNNTWTSEVKRNYGGALTWVAVDLPAPDGFSLDKDGWSFANSSFSFREDSESPFSAYYIPEERYDEVFGTAYLEANRFSKSWGGNCAGMSTTAILFFLDYLNWQAIDDGYPNDFSTPNSFYQTINYHYASQSGYAAIGNDTEVTRLIEAYQLYINEVDRSEYEALLDNTYHAEEFTKDGIFSYYTQEHLSNGTYISSMLEVFSKAYEENTPLYISLKGDDFSHAIVSRTDKNPEDMGNGWWRVYVYDPNKPYLNELIAEKFWEEYPDAGLKDACNDLEEDVYIELNPSQNLWRYCTSVNSDRSSKYLGCNLNNEVLYIKCDAKDGEGNKLTVKIPEYFYTINLNDIQINDYVHPTTTAWMPESTDDGCIISADAVSNCLVYSSSGELIAVVENGEAIVMNGSGHYVGYTGEAEESTPVGGKLYLPSDTYTIQYTSGQMAFLGSSNVISFSCDTSTELTVDMVTNSVHTLAIGDGSVSIKCANVISAGECSYVETEGTLVAGETFTIAYSDENKVETSTDSKDGEFQLYQKNADQDEAVATKVVKANNLWWLWIIGGAVIIGVAALFILVKRKNNKQKP